MCRHICVEDMIKWLMLFRISSPLIWAPSLCAQTGIPVSESLWIRHCLKLKKNFVCETCDIFRSDVKSQTPSPIPM